MATGSSMHQNVGLNIQTMSRSMSRKSNSLNQSPSPKSNGKNKPRLSLSQRKSGNAECNRELSVARPHSTRNRSAGSRSGMTSSSVDEGLEMATVDSTEAILQILDLREAGVPISKEDGKYSKRKRASIAYMESTVVDISIPPPSFKLVAWSLSRISSI